MREFHAAHSDVGIELEVTRRPYSFHGGTPAEAHTWKWRTGLSVYCGDQVLNQLLSAGLLTAEQASLMQTDPRRAFADAKLTNAITLLAQHSGFPPPDFGRIVAEHEQAAKADFGWARGRKVSAFDHVCGERAVETLSQLGRSGRAAPIRFRFDVDFSWHPVESQRSLAWAGRFGKQEELVDVLARLHFEEATSVNRRSTLLVAATEVGLDADALSAFLDTREGEAEVWQSYSDTTSKHGIHSIPFFVFNGAGLSNGGPFRGNGHGGHTVRGSASVDEFGRIFESVLRESHVVRSEMATAGVGRQARAAGAPAAAAGVGRGGGATKAGGMKKGFLLG